MGLTKSSKSARAARCWPAREPGGSSQLPPRSDPRRNHRKAAPGEPGISRPSDPHRRLKHRRCVTLQFGRPGNRGVQTKIPRLCRAPEAIECLCYFVCSRRDLPCTAPRGRYPPLTPWPSELKQNKPTVTAEYLMNSLRASPAPPCSRYPPRVPSWSPKQVMAPALTLRADNEIGSRRPHWQKL